MIKILERQIAPKGLPYFLLTYEYMVGDADGQQTTEVKLSIDNPYIEKYCKILDKLEKTKENGAIIFIEDDLEFHYTEGQITKEECEFLIELMFCDANRDKFKRQFSDGILGENEYQYRYFEYYMLTYIDEDGLEYPTKFIDSE